MIGAGDLAPDFEAVDGKGAPFRLSTLRGHQVILYFFPKSFTAGCTLETREFAKLAPSLAEKGVQVVGVSVDTVETQGRFASECSAAFPILSDGSKSISRSYGVLSLLGLSKRATFFIDEKGVVRDVVVSLLPGPHLFRSRSRYLSPA